MTPEDIENEYARYSNSYVAAVNDIGTGLIVRTIQDESPEDLCHEVIVGRGGIRDGHTLVFYFNTGEEFYDWLDKLNKTFPRPKHAEAA